jgi:hypothetical protein
MASIPCHFEEMYAMAGHLPTLRGGRAAAGDAWVGWWDDCLPDQLLLYKSFVSYWMAREGGAIGEILGGGRVVECDRRNGTAVVVVVIVVVVGWRLGGIRDDCRGGRGSRRVVVC